MSASAASGGKELDILVLGVDPSYQQIRRMRVVSRKVL